ncbi:hypothetical protein [Sphingomonas carotinifaciens]|uniref:Uncharacterized protein n=1 Tax=Sphingomonas carotinifaciens TaxID=1166323 RepID=A0A6N8LTL7_9SPHN|nr:hypothetical protein [Sphingomonas carotinifaciens]MWC43649.1 hypothetical protein [Sphingomonas carotinifaciens]
MHGALRPPCDHLTVAAREHRYPVSSDAPEMLMLKRGEQPPLLDPRISRHRAGFSGGILSRKSSLSLFGDAMADAYAKRRPKKRPLRERPKSF